jgi:SAM-dependent methyltransferase
LDSPDRNATGFVPAAVDRLRYNVYAPIAYEPTEVIGMTRAMVPAGSRVLDVGCGAGWRGKELREARGCEVIGVEPDEGRAEVARSLGVEVVTGYLEAIDVERIGRFDVVLFGDVLEHLPDPAAMLLAAREYLKPGGAIVASVPNVAHWTVRWDLLWGEFDYQPSGIMDATHLRWFTEKTLRGLFDAAGYRVVAWEVTAGAWMPDYRFRRPWKWLSDPYRIRLVRACARRFPNLFGCQHVVRAVPAAD